MHWSHLDPTLGLAGAKAAKMPSQRQRRSLPEAWVVGSMQVQGAQLACSHIGFKSVLANKVQNQDSNLQDLGFLI